MDCFNDLCVYWKGNKCILSEISINEMGICDEYISINIPNAALKKYRNKHLLDIVKRENEIPSAF